MVAKVTTLQQPQEMFNLTVDEAPTFYVRDSGWLVHNAGGPNVVYRVIRLSENPSVGLFGKDVSSVRDITGHVLNGSKAGYAINWISTTRDVNVAMK